MSPRSPRARLLLLGAALAVLCAAVYAPGGGHDFVNFDDGEYVYENPVVAEGLTWDGVAWAFGSRAANWHPLAWLSHMADVELFGMRPGPQHLTGAAIHLAAVLALFLALVSATRPPVRRIGGPAHEAVPPSPLRSAAVAALFAAHPLNVETVAWISERKSVLSALFSFLAIWAYVGFTRRPARARYLLVAALFALALLSKPMAVTLPALLLLLDVWPLGRMTIEPPLSELPRRAFPLVKEKLPILALSALAAALTIHAQSGWQATASVDAYPLGDRLRNAAVSIGAYLADAVWPVSLAVFHPHPSSFGEPVPWGRAVVSALLALAVTALAFRVARRRPYLLVGWLWYLVALLPVLGLVQVGSQSRADRYTYVPMIGIFIACVFGLGELVESRPELRPAVAALSLAALLALAVRASVQVRTWKDGATLYGHAVRVTKRNWLAWNNLGTYHLSREELAPALDCFREAIAIRPDYPEARYNIGVVFTQASRPVEAIAAYREALRLAPDNADALGNLGNAYLQIGRPEEAVPCYRRALELRPGDPVATRGLEIATR